MPDPKHNLKGTWLLEAPALEREEWKRAFIVAVLVKKLGGKVEIDLEQVVSLGPRTLIVEDDRINSRLIIQLHPDSVLDAHG